MEELELEDWFDDTSFDVGLDEYLTHLFIELDNHISASNVNNFNTIEEQCVINSMRKSLLLWISPISELDNNVAKVKEIWRPESIFVLVDRYEEELTTAYVSWNTQYYFRQEGVIKVNKKGTTIYTIDALNALSMHENGKIDKQWSPNWNEFENQILLSDIEGNFKQIPTRVLEKIKL